MSTQNTNKQLKKKLLDMIRSKLKQYNREDRFYEIVAKLHLATPGKNFQKEITKMVNALDLGPELRKAKIDPLKIQWDESTSNESKGILGEIVKSIREKLQSNDYDEGYFDLICENYYQKRVTKNIKI